ncbi:MAG TPA: response regulator, partial [bacterium]|nr:response regulator [bacterium]
MRPFNIMIVDDSKFMRESIINLLKTEQDMNIAAEASNGLEAINTLKSSTIPIDVIIMDIEMPIMDGAEATKVIMKEKPTSIILLSALTREHKKTITALLNGAFDFIQKPGGKSITFDIDKVKKDLIEKIRFSAIANLTQRFGKKKEFEAAKRKISRYYDLVLIGTSTGGPGTLAKIFKIMPASFDIPIAVVQHIKEGYSKSLAEGLNSAS